MYCSKCGNEVAPGAKFCPKCGNAIAQGAAATAPEATRPAPAPGATQVAPRPESTYQAAPAPSAPQPTPAQAPIYAPPKKGHGLRNAIIGIVTILVVAVAAISVAGPAFGGPNFVNPLDFSSEAQVKRAVNGYFEEFENFDFEGAVNGVGTLLGSDASAYLQSYLNQLSAYGFDIQEVMDAFLANFGWTITDVNVVGDAATCDVMLTFPDFDALDDQVSSQVDFTSLTYDQQVDAVIEALRNPTAPTTTQEISLNLVNANGTWTINHLADLTSWLLENMQG